MFVCISFFVLTPPTPKVTFPAANPHDSKSAILPERVAAPSKGSVGWTKNLDGMAVRNSESQVDNLFPSLAAYTLTCLFMVPHTTPSPEGVQMALKGKTQRPVWVLWLILTAAALCCLKSHTLRWLS